MFLAHTHHWKSSSASPLYCPVIIVYVTSWCLCQALNVATKGFAGIRVLRAFRVLRLFKVFKYIKVCLVRAPFLLILATLQLLVLLNAETLHILAVDLFYFMLLQFVASQTSALTSAAGSPAHDVLLH